jgi:hypothetical protein
MDQNEFYPERFLDPSINKNANMPFGIVRIFSSLRIYFILEIEIFFCDLIFENRDLEYA